MVRGTFSPPSGPSQTSVGTSAAADLVAWVWAAALSCQSAVCGLTVKLARTSSTYQVPALTVVAEARLVPPKKPTLTFWEALT
jgi:hypothetical protein